jgi:hypothetical protein
MADKLTGDHQVVKNLLATLDTLGADDATFDMQLRARWVRTYCVCHTRLVNIEC